MIENSARAVSAATIAETDPSAAELMQSVVDVARAIFGAQASSVFLLDELAHELIFYSVSGQGEGFLVGRRFPATSGIAGWVVASGEPMVVDDLSSVATFDRELAESTRYMPNSLMAAPLVHDERMLGVLEVLDPAPQSRSNLNELDLLALFARQAAAALRVVVDRHPPSGERGPAGLGLDADGRAAALQLAASLHRLLAIPAP
ncbi:GAF domain-containing protein [Dactylosporangium sp. CA-092794]|uniref:GAF domain-containing protein n=1 Tax=Dactylosporangium sp. CA-092794 TaxID=3239929 RepID=UPI003D8F0F68